MQMGSTNLVIEVAGAVGWALLLALGGSLAPVHNLIHAACACDALTSHEHILPHWKYS